jgi:flagellar biosynthetic protein FliR
MTTVMCFYAIEAGGRIVDSQRGSANAQIFLPALGQVSVFGLFQYWVGLAVFCAIGGHIIFLNAFLESYQIIPVMTLPKIAPGFSPFLEIMIRMSADVLVLGMQMAAPVLIGVFLTDLVLGIANKVAPQIPVFEIGFMLKGYIGVAMVYVSLMVVVGQMEEFFNTMQDNVRRVILYFGA